MLKNCSSCEHSFIDVGIPACSMTAEDIQPDQVCDLWDLGTWLSEEDEDYASRNN
jgi:hypothetical protein